MKKTIEVIKRSKYVLEEKDIYTIKQCLNYGYHRLNRHRGCGIDGIVDIREINRLRKEFNIT